MGINMKVFSLPDEEIRASIADPKRIAARLEYPSAVDAAELWNQWRAVDFVVGPQSSVMKGDITIEDAGWEGTHAIHSASVASFAQKLGALSDAAVRERLDPVEMRAAGVWVAEYPGAVDEIFPEILSAFHKLRDLARRAEAQGNGLVFCRYES